MKGAFVFSVLTLLALGTSPAVFAAVRGSCADDAEGIAIGTKEQVVQDLPLIPEYNPDNGKYYFVYKAVDTNSTPWVTNTVVVTNFVHYYRAKLLRGKEYSVWLTDADGYPIVDTNAVISSIEPESAKDEDEFEPGAWFDLYSGGWGSMMVMPADSWEIDPEDPEFSDPPSWYYTIKIVGRAGEKATLHYRVGNALPAGIEENPVKLKVGLAEQVDGPRQFVRGEREFKYEVEFKEGRRYVFATEGGTEANPYGLAFYGSGRTFPYDAGISAWNDAQCFDSSGDWAGVVVISNSFTDAAGATFRLHCRQIPTRAISKHDCAEIELGPKGVVFAPGKLSKYGNEFFDGIVDEGLFSFNAAAGEKYVAYTEGAVTNLMMRIYDSKGTILYENTDCGAESDFNVRCGFSVSQSGRYYVGVCQNLDDYDREQPLYANVKLKVETLQPKLAVPDKWDYQDDDYLGATELHPVPAARDDHPFVADRVVDKDWHKLDLTDWYDVFAINGCAGYSYSLAVSNENAEALHNGLTAKLFTMNGTREVTVKHVGNIKSGTTNVLTFAATANQTYFLRLSISGASGQYYPEYRVHSTMFETETGAKPKELGTLAVMTRGCDSARWAVNEPASKSSGYLGCASMQVPAGTYEVQFLDVSGFQTPRPVTVEVVAGRVSDPVEGIYNDKYDPGDDVLSKAQLWDVANYYTTRSRTLWANDPQDAFAFTVEKESYFYSFEFSRNVGENLAPGDAVFTICSDAAGTPVTDAAGNPVANVASVSGLCLDKARYYVSVHHRDSGKPLNTQYVLRGIRADVGTVGFAKSAVKVKRSAGSVSLQVKRTASDGRIRVAYATVAGTATPGEMFAAKSGILEWAAGDKSTKTIVIPVIPAMYSGDGGAYDFSVRLEAMSDEELAKGEYPALLTVDECVVTIADSTGKSKKEQYAAKQAKVAKSKDVNEPLTVGDYYGVLSAEVSEDAASGRGTAPVGALSTGFPALASLSFSATAADKLSAKVAVAGKKYSLKNGAWGDSTNGVRRCDLEAKGVRLTLWIAEGESFIDWAKARGDAVLTLDVPAVKGAPAQPGIVYRGEIYRDNSKVQGYYDDAAVKFAGYYTMALKTVSEIGYSGGMPLAPAGNGYMGITVDRKGNAKVSGQLADGTKISLSATACAIRHETIEVGTNKVSTFAMYVPLFVAKYPYCFGGTLRLYCRPITAPKPDGTMSNPDPYRKDFDTVADSTANVVANLVWNNDNAALSYEGQDGWRLALVPVGGWYDTVYNLQAYYKSYALAVDTATVEEFPSEALSEDFAYVDLASAQPGSVPVSLLGNTISVPSKSLVKEDGWVLLDDSVNPCDVKIKLKRATGIVSGSFTVWMESDDALKALKGMKHNGIVILQRDNSEVLSSDVLSAGFFNFATKVSRDVDYNEQTGKYKARKWTLSLPFNLVATPEE